jgi:hypothetical protein
MTTLAIGTALALAALAFVLYPLVSGAEGDPQPAARRGEPSEAERAVDALREVEFDRATGKLSDDDYAALRGAYTAEAVRAMRSADAPKAPDEAVEALIQRYRHLVVTCPRCGERPETAAAFCSSCGRRLAG